MVPVLCLLHVEQPMVEQWQVAQYYVGFPGNLFHKQATQNKWNVETWKL